MSQSPNDDDEPGIDDPPDLEFSRAAGICPTCNGSGEGMFDGSICRDCDGEGER